LHGRTITVSFDTNLNIGHSCIGICQHHTGEIKLQPPSTYPMANDLVDATFFHEMTHAILYAMGREDLNQDENFVDVFSGLFHQALKTAHGLKIEKEE
jgi:predicted SprT family Zn-dependent metalloprotease